MAFALETVTVPGVDAVSARVTYRGSETVTLAEKERFKVDINEKVPNGKKWTATVLVNIVEEDA